MTGSASRSVKVAPVRLVWRDAVLVGLIWLTGQTILYHWVGPREGGDTIRYVEAAAAWGQGQWPSGRDAFFPIYNLFLAALFGLGLGTAGVVLVQCLLSGVAAWRLYHLAASLYDHRVGILAALLYVTCPELQVWNLYVLTESLFVSLTIVALSLLVSAERPGAWVAAGVATLAAAMVRPHGLALLGAAAAFGLAALRPGARLTVGAVVGGVAVAAVIGRAIQPWVRVAGQYRRGTVIWGYPASATPLPDLVLPSGMAGHPVLEFLGVLVTQPRSVVSLAVRRVAYEWLHIRPFYSMAHNAIIAATLFPLYLLAAWGVTRQPRRPGARVLLLGLPALQSMFVALSFADWDGRHLLVMLPSVFVFAAAGAIDAFDRAWAWRRWPRGVFPSTKGDDARVSRHRAAGALDECRQGHKPRLPWSDRCYHPPVRGERIRVLRVIARLNIGGPALHTMLLNDRLDPRRYDSRLVVGTEEPGEGNYATFHGMVPERVTVLPALGRAVRGTADIAVFSQLLRLMRRVRPHVVHTHTAKAGTLGRLAARLVGVPIVVHTYHGHVFRGYFPPGRTRVFLAIERFLGRRTDCLLAVSETVRQELLALGVGSPERFRVMPLGLDLDRYLRAEATRGSLRAELGIRPDTPVVAIVARLVPIKAHEVFLRAARLVCAALPSSQFLVVGDGERREALERLTAELGLGANVRFLGWRRDLERVYADTWVVALTSRNEGSPVSLIEAMAAERPVVATRVGGVPDLVEDGVTGCLVPPDDPKALAEALVTLLQNPERRQVLGKAARERVIPAFVAGRLVADMDALYQDLLRAKGIAVPC